MLKEKYSLDESKVEEYYDRFYKDVELGDDIDIKGKVHEILHIINRWNKYLYDQKRVCVEISRLRDKSEKAIINIYTKGDDYKFKELNDKLKSHVASKEPIIVLYKSILEDHTILLEFIEESFNTLKFNLTSQCQMIVDLIKQEDSF